MSTLSNFSVGYTVVKDDEVYRITDYSIQGVTISVTELHKGKATRGHSHPDAECYYFATDAIVRLGHKTYEVRKGQMVLVRPNDFHRVYAPLDKECIFVCMFEGARSATEIPSEGETPEK